MKNNTQMSYVQTAKQWFIYMLIAFPFMLISSTALTIIKAQLWIILVCDVLIGFVIVLLCYVIHSKIKEKREDKLKNEKFDPFKD